MISTDLDGTLLGANGHISPRNWDALTELGKQNVVRVIATGRSEFSARSVLPQTLPIDYLVVSSGACIIDWASGDYLKIENLSARQATTAAQVLTDLHLDFMVHEPVPRNHRFGYRRAQSRGCADFERRIERYVDHCYDASEEPTKAKQEAGQLLAVHDVDPNRTPKKVHEVASQLPELTVLRTTSPLDGQSVWIEVFPKSVSKSQACAWIADRHDIKAHQVTAVGNDTNDLDMLRWAGRSAVVANAHPSLLEEFPVVAHCDEDGFHQAVAQESEDGGRSMS